MQIIDVTKKLPWKKSVGKQSLKNIKYLVIHHDAAPSNKPYDTMKRLIAHSNQHIKNGWGHVSYHYQMDNDGVVFQCVPETEVGFHAGNYQVNIRAIALCIHGNFEQHDLNSKQKKALKDFIEWITTQRPDLPLVVKSTIRGHRDVRTRGTACPGRNLYALVKPYIPKSYFAQKTARRKMRQLRAKQK